MWNVGVFGVARTWWSLRGWEDAAKRRVDLELDQKKLMDFLGFFILFF